MATFLPQLYSGVLLNMNHHLEVPTPKYVNINILYIKHLFNVCKQIARANVKVFFFFLLINWFQFTQLIKLILTAVVFNVAFILLPTVEGSSVLLDSLTISNKNNFIFKNKYIILH